MGGNRGEVGAEGETVWVKGRVSKPHLRRGNREKIKTQTHYPKFKKGDDIL